MRFNFALIVKLISCENVLIKISSIFIYLLCDASHLPALRIIEHNMYYAEVNIIRPLGHHLLSQVFAVTYKKSISLIKKKRRCRKMRKWRKEAEVESIGGH